MTQAVLGAEYFGPVAGSPLLPPHILTFYFILFLILLCAAYVYLHRKRKPVYFKHKVKLLLVATAAIQISLIGGSLFVAGYWLIPQPNIMHTNPPKDASNSLTTQKIEIEFDRPVSRKLLEKQITPDVPGRWIFEDAMYATHLYRKLVFYPTESLATNTSYTIKLSHIKNMLNVSAPYDYSFSFKTQESPKVMTVIPSDKKQGVAIEKPIIIKLTQPNDNVSQFDFEFSPNIPLNTTLDAEKHTYTLTPKQKLQQGTDYQIKIRKTDLTWNLQENKIINRSATAEEYTGSFKTQEAPGVQTFTPSQDNAPITSTISLVFSQDMDKESVADAFSIDPPTQGALSWKDTKTLIFTPDKLAYEKNYKITIGKGAKALHSSSYIEEDITKQFTTIGSAKVTSIYPNDSWKSVAITNPIKMTFDQDVNKKSAESHFLISPPIPGSFRWEGTTMIFQPASPFTYATTYTATLKSGIQSTQGLDSKKEFATTFTTQEGTFRLPVPIYLQQHTLSCELASLRMALAYKNVHVSEEKLLDQVGVDTTPHNGNIWGDPYSLFVGNVNGKQMADGYGVYWGPIARVARLYRNAEEFQNWSISQLTDALSKGNAVVIWVYSSGGYPTSWRTPDGKEIFALRDEHAVTAVGFVGRPDNPSEIIINDPLYGQVYWSRSLFDRKWNSFGRSGVVVY